MSDSSPLFQRKIRRKAPVITTSQDSPVRPRSKKTVPPSPGDKVSDTSPPTVPPSPGHFKSPSSAPATPSHDVPPAVPPSPGHFTSPSSDPATPSHDVPSPKPKRARKRNGRSKKHVSRRQQMLRNPLLDLLQAQFIVTSEHILILDQLPTGIFLFENGVICSKVTET